MKSAISVMPRPAPPYSSGYHDAEKAVLGDLLEHLFGKGVPAGVIQPVGVVEFLRELGAVVVDLALLIV
ncbi:hypothetical protein [Mesorhizobium sp. J428]|uniref:hypothetical protein n=1 Tax=Mesorhizobium sp. J428 TaxID=2898440 RepID=UPI002150A751|nr:hypothetical protein [Mesorhizobium sp. J428]MCR5860425.1 hypothetical protein [Mesorhizobium sp. J428]